MKKFFLSMALGASLLFAGGDIAPVEPVVSVPEVTSNLGVYVGGFAQAEKELKDYGIGAVVGYDLFNLYDVDVAIEARASRANVEDGVLRTYAAFIKPSYDLGFVTVYGLAGYGQVDADATVRYHHHTRNITDKQDGFTYGGGISKKIACNTEVFVDYVVSPKVFDDEPQTVQLGVTYKF